MNIAIVGLGYVGAVSAGCLARMGHLVIGVDADQAKMAEVAAGRSPVGEPGLDELLGEGVAGEMISTATIEDAVPEADLVMIAVGTPSRDDGGLDDTALLRASEQVGRALPSDGRFRVVVVRSTVLPGTTEGKVIPRLEQASGMRAGHGFGVATNPEFLREGAGVRDFFEAGRTIIGADDERSRDLLSSLYSELSAPIISVPIRTSEVVKYADNAFHALKITFANEMGVFARHAGVDGREVLELLVSDDKLNISPAYLRPGFAFGGSCLPKDLRALLHRARSDELDLPLLSSILRSNEAHLQRAVDLVIQSKQTRVGIYGLSFKSATDDLRESPAVALVERLVGLGCEVIVFDEDVRPGELRGANRLFIDQHLPGLRDLLVDSLDELIERSAVIAVTKKPTDEELLWKLLRPEQHLLDFSGLSVPTKPAPEYAGIAW